MEQAYIYFPLILLLALAIDLACGEPPAALHPVVWMGKVISFLSRNSKGVSPRAQFIMGTGVVLATIALFTVPVYFGLTYLKSFNMAAYIIVAAVILKTSFALRVLRQAALKVRNLLMAEKLPEARFEVRALVGRDTRKLDRSQLVSATVESLAENSCDSFFAPLFYFLLFGVAGAVAYRAVNTLDAMIGHHGEFEYLGKFAARLDSAANFIPARLAALLIIFSSPICRARAAAAWRTMRRDGGRTESPNAGLTMSAAAGALGVQLEKVGYYRLGDGINALETGTIDASLRLITVASAAWAVIVILAEVIYYAATAP